MFVSLSEHGVTAQARQRMPEQVLELRISAGLSFSGREFRSIDQK
jgi:hypothetical protein